MGWKIENGITVRYQRPEIDVSVTPPEIAVESYVCGECGKIYKTESGLTKHTADKH